MNPITLALVTSYLDALQKRKEWREPVTKIQLVECYSRYGWHISPSKKPSYELFLGSGARV